MVERDSLNMDSSRDAPNLSAANDGTVKFRAALNMSAGEALFNVQARDMSHEEPTDVSPKDETVHAASGNSNLNMSIKKLSGANKKKNSITTSKFATPKKVEFKEGMCISH